MGKVTDSAGGVVITVTTSTGTPVLTDTLTKNDNGSWFSGDQTHHPHLHRVPELTSASQLTGGMSR